MSLASRRLWRPSSYIALGRVGIADRLFSSENHRLHDDTNKSPFESPVDWSQHKNNNAQTNGQNRKNLVGDLDEAPRTSILMELTDRVGVLHDVLKHFWKYDVNITRIESRPHRTGKFDFFVDIDGNRSEVNVKNALEAITPLSNKLLILDSKDVYWFPRHISELDLIANRTLDAGVDLESDHPGFHDGEYRVRRSMMAENAKNHKWDQPIPRVEYTHEEREVWGAVWDKMEGLLEEYACEEYLESLNLMKKHCGYSRTDIPQQEDISTFLAAQSNFHMRPVAGLLSSRDFLNGLAFRVFFCTQYIRHHSMPLYTPDSLLQ